MKSAGVVVKSFSFPPEVPGLISIDGNFLKSADLLKPEVSKNSGKKAGIDSCCSTTLCEGDP